jgi:hypothetical protein
MEDKGIAGATACLEFAGWPEIPSNGFTGAFTPSTAARE